MKVKVSNANQPNWHTITVKADIPEALQPLNEMAHNLWWTWNQEGQDVFAAVDRQGFKDVNRNPVELLATMDYDKLNALSKDKEFMKQMTATYKTFRAYMDEKPNTERASVAYFCMEYGLSHILKIYSGGLGVLAGDYLKEASDSNVDLCAVGFLYRYGYFSQSLSLDGQQIANYNATEFDHIPVVRVKDEQGNHLTIRVPFPGRDVYAAVWQVNVGRIKLFLLDTDVDLNADYDRSITHSLYGGDWENRIKQEFLLGIGGMLALEAMGIKKDIYHCNEGHAALCNVQRLVDYVNTGLNFDEALELVRASSLYTVHTPVPAGHDYFEESLFGRYLGGYAEKLGISWEEFMGLGRTNPDNHEEKFCMSTFLCKTCQEVNGVSWLHGKVSQQMFNDIWQGYFPEENHVGYVTNGVHLPTWSAKEWKAVFEKNFGKDFLNKQATEEAWQKIYDVADEDVWATRVHLKNKLVKYIRGRFKDNWLKNQGDPSRVMSLLDKINPNALLIGFARRFATYKRAHLLFTDLERLAKIVNDPERPVQFLFAGKAHPADGAGQGLIKYIYEISQRPEFIGKIIFLEDYDMQLARRLVSGVDIWMNTPTRPLEASGTSGEKALMNGVVNLSVLDGWWYEGYREGAGWALTDKRTYDNQEYQDRLDASTIYQLLETEIIPLYFDRQGKEYSEGWIQTVKNSMARIAPHYTMRRQLDDYYEKFYNPQSARYKYISANNNKVAKGIAAWKANVAEKWDSIRVVSSERMPDPSGIVTSGEKLMVTHVIDEAGLDDAIGIELVMVENINGKDVIQKVIPMELIKREGTLYTFQLTTAIEVAGTIKVAYRMFPKHQDLPSRQDFCYVRWFY